MHSTYAQSFAEPKPRWQTRGWKLRRKPGLGHYNATRDQWYKTWRNARLKRQRDLEADYSNSLECKAFSILMLQRGSRCDSLHSNTAARKREYELAAQIIENLKAEELI